MNAEEFKLRVAQAEPGHVIEYHGGYIAADRDKNSEVDLLAEAVAYQAQAGRVLLTQQRLGPIGQWAYLATVAEDTSRSYWTKPCEEWAGLV